MAENTNKVCYFIGLLLSTMVLVGLVIAYIMACDLPEKSSWIILLNITTKRNGSDDPMLYTKLIPEDYLFGMWFIVICFQVIWVGFAWSFIFKPNRPIMINSLSLHLSAVGNFFSIALFVPVVNDMVVFSYLATMTFSIPLLVLATSLQILFMYRNTFAWMESKGKFKYDLLCARLFVLNGMVMNTTQTIMTMVNATAALCLFTFDVETARLGFVVCLAVLVQSLVCYFILENTCWDPVLRYIVTVYPVIAWMLSGTVRDMVSQKSSTGITAFALFCLASVTLLFLVRVFFMIVFSFYKPIEYPNHEENAKVQEKSTTAKQKILITVEYAEGKYKMNL